LRLLLARKPGLSVVAEAENLEQLRSDATECRPDVILLDMDLRGLAPAELRALCTRATTIVLSTREERRQEAVASGAAAFVCKCEPPQGLLAALQTIAAADFRAT
jgi:DNA-binding NarL/FixJ family response regulator